MDIYERIKEVCDEKGYSINRLEKELAFPRSSISKYKSSSPSIDKIQAIASHLGVTVDYLTTGKNNKSDNKSVLNAKDEKDIAKDMEAIRAKLLNKEDGPASFDGEDIDEADIDLVLDGIEMMLKRLKRINKEKYNPNKNKK